MMKETNKIAKIFKIMGIVIFGIGIIFSTILGNMSNFIVTIIAAIYSFIACMGFVGFGEVVSLLQANLDGQLAIYQLIEENNTDDEDKIEDNNNSNNMPTANAKKIYPQDNQSVNKVYWKCHNCGTICTNEFCPNCGNHKPQKQ